MFKSAFPTLLDHGYVQWPAIGLFGILAPIAFAKTLHNYFSSTEKTTKLLTKPLGYLFLYLAIFLHANISFYGANSTYYNLALITNVYPSTLFNDLVKAEKEEERHMVAKLIYSEYGAKFPYPCAGRDTARAILSPWDLWRTQILCCPNLAACP